MFLIKIDRSATSRSMEGLSVSNASGWFDTKCLTHANRTIRTTNEEKILKKREPNVDKEHIPTESSTLSELWSLIIVLADMVGIEYELRYWMEYVQGKASGGYRQYRCCSRLQRERVERRSPSR